jgi:hypothetical protein
MTATTKIHFYAQGFLFCSGRSNRFACTTTAHDEITCGSCLRKIAKKA